MGVGRWARQHPRVTTAFVGLSLLFGLTTLGWGSAVLLSMKIRSDLSSRPARVEGNEATGEAALYFKKSEAIANSEDAGLLAFVLGGMGGAIAVLGVEATLSLRQRLKKQSTWELGGR